MARELKPCGTEAAYRRHWRYGQTPCEACYAANRAYNRAYHGRAAATGQLIRQVIHVLACELGVGRQL